jgi:galactokinase
MKRRSENAETATISLLHASFRRHFDHDFDHEPTLYRAPGRVNLIGEHTDYNAGFVMPVAISRYTYAAVRPRGEGRLRVHSTNFGETIELPRDPAATCRELPAHARHWSDYVWGVAQSLRAHGLPLAGADLLVHGDLPLGAGLSSSAALEVSSALALTMSVGAKLEPLRLVRLCQCAEDQYVGMRCGIMDQFAAVFGREGYALCLDCRSLAYRPVPLDTCPAPGTRAVPARLVICNTMVRHHLAASEYNLRREQCERAVALLAASRPEVHTLRDVTLEDLGAARAQLGELLYRRCRHVVSENERVTAGAVALEAGDYDAFGRLMAESHRSLANDYQVSCEELDLLVRLASELEGVYGGRMTGGGFGGCTVNLVRADSVERFRAAIAERYQQATGQRPETYVCASADGAACFSIEHRSGRQSWQRVDPA